MTRRFTMLLAGLAAAVLAVAMGGAASAADAPDSRGVPLVPLVPSVRITDVAPEPVLGGVPRDTSILVDFQSDITTDSVFANNIKLKKKGARKAVPMFGSYTYASDVFEGYPENILQPDTAYQVIVDGGKLGRVDDPTARFKDGNVVWGFRTAE